MSTKQCPLCRQNIPERTEDEEKKRVEHYRKKDIKFAKRRMNDDWPIDSCLSCKRLGGCCKSYSHHIGDCCLHCGNDERGVGLV